MQEEDDLGDKHVEAATYSIRGLQQLLESIGRTVPNLVVKSSPCRPFFD